MQLARTQIYLTAAENAALKREARTTGRSKSQLIRDAVDEKYVKRKDKAALIAAIKASAGAWGPGENGEAYVERMRPGRFAKRMKALHDRRR